MGRHGAGWLMAGLLGLAAGAGCAGLPKSLPALPDMGGAGTDRAEKELAAGEAARVCFTLGREMEKAGHLAEAVGQYELARHNNPNLPGVGRRLAVVYDRLGNFSQAQAEYERALKANPKDADLLNDLGYHHYSRGRWEDAEDHLRKAVALAPRHRLAWMNLGLTLAQQGRNEESLEAFGHVVRPAEAQCNLAFVLTAQGKKDEARAAYRQALAQEPDLRLARLALGKLEAPPAKPGQAAKGAQVKQVQAGAGQAPGQPGQTVPAAATRTVAPPAPLPLLERPQSARPAGSGGVPYPAVAP
jgi:tetratricopeptide (TPR) repeat protein